MYIDIFNLCILLAIFFSGGLVFFLGFYVANNISFTNKTNDLIEVKTPIIKNAASSIKVNTKKEEQEQESEHTTFYN